MQIKLWGGGVTNVDFDGINKPDQIFYILQILEKKWEHNNRVYQVFIDFKKACDSLRREALYNILFEFKIPRKLVGLIKMCLNETYSTMGVGKICLTGFLFRMAWKSERLYHHCFST
jgi:hypothetical protein